jgi:hypothetical protein
MPKIPGIDYRENAVPGPVPTSAVTPDQMGAGTGRGFQALGASLQTLTNTIHEVYQDSQAGKAAARAQQRIQDFAYSLKAGSVDPETGKKLPPPPPNQHYELYQKEVEKINQDAERELDGRALTGFNAQFKPFAMRHGYVVRENALNLYNADIQANVDESLQQDAVTFVNDEGMNKAAIQASAFARIDKLQAAGIYTPHEALARRRNFLHDTAVGSITKMMKKNPDDVVQAIDKGEFNKDLDVDKLQHYRARALEEGDRQLRRKIMDEEHAENRQRRKEHEVQQDTFKDLYAQLIDKKLTPGSVLEEQENLSPEHFKILLDAASGRGTTHSDPQILSNLIIRATKGEDVTGDATNAAVHALISVEDMKSVINHVHHEGVALEVQNVYKSGQSYIHETMKDIPGVQNPAGQVNRANALREWTDWVVAHPKATPEQGRKVADSIVRDYALINFDKMSLAAPLPRFVGGRADLSPDNPKAMENIQKAMQATDKALEEKQIDEYEYKREMQKLNRWRTAIPVATPSPTPTN